MFFFVAIVAVVFWAAHGAVYCFFVRFFAIRSVNARIILALVLFFLSVSFIAAAALLRMHDGPLARLAYSGAAIWLGALINLLVFIGLAALINLAAGVFRRKPNGLVLGAAVLAAAVFYSGWGLWAAYHPRVEEVSVPVAGLPAAWEEKIIVQLSDVHLGAALGPDYLRRLAGQVNALDPDVILITGDLFDGMAGDPAPFIESLNRLRAKSGIFFVSGNHEVYTGMNKVMAALSQTDIRVLDDDLAEIDGLQIIGAGYASYLAGKDIKAMIMAKENFDRAKPGILMFHSPTDIDRTGLAGQNVRVSMYFSSDTGFTAAKELGIDLQLSGHTHKGQLFPFGLLTRLIYRGFDYGLNKSGDMHVYTSSGAGVWGPTMRTSGRCEITLIKLTNAK